ncbi:MAG TPA: hypothetical protein VNA57_05030 [Acidimicrobiales bacterium]|nr:hypothetical protein [Acidimicrobiales bacterium]
MSEALFQRLSDRDPSLWPAGNVSATRLGWLDVVSRMRTESDEIMAWARGIDAGKVVLLGMGGSSLGPEVLRAAVGSERLVVLDTTEPGTVAAVDTDDAFFLVSSKSGSTLEPQALLSYFWSKVPDGARFAAITDPGSPLDEQATDSGFSRVFRNPADIGGRYSVLSYFGLVPAALCGIDIGELCEQAMSADTAQAVELGVAMGEAALAGRDKLTVVVPRRFAAFGLWVEQLVAESTGKRGLGVIPVPTTEVETGDDRHVVALELEEPAQLASEFMRWMIAAAVAGHTLGVDPFDEPDVAVAKANTAKVLANLPLSEPTAADPAGVTEWLEAQVRPGDYVSVQAYLPFGQDTELERLRRTLRDGLGGMAVTSGYGPRFLHSTGQLHKGGPNTVVAVQLVGRTPVPSVPIPSLPYDFGTLIAAQSLGDYQSLVDRGRRVLRVAVDDLKEIG